MTHEEITIIKEKVVHLIEEWRDALPFIENIFTDHSYYFTLFDLDNLVELFEKEELEEEIKKVCIEEIKVFRRYCIRSKRRNIDKGLHGLTDNLEKYFENMKAEGENPKNG